MTKLEYDTFEEGPCPCGSGHILRHVESTDYRYSSVHISYSINCPDCNRQWRIDHGTLVLRASEAPYLAAKVEADSAREKLHQFAQKLVLSYCETLLLKSKKAELQHLQALNLSQTKYASYLKERGAGKEMHQLAYGLRNIPWLKERAEASGNIQELVELLRIHEDMSKNLEVASKQIVRRSVRRD